MAAVLQLWQLSVAFYKAPGDGCNVWATTGGYYHVLAVTRSGCDPLAVARRGYKTGTAAAHCGGSDIDKNEVLIHFYLANVHVI